MSFENIIDILAAKEVIIILIIIGIILFVYFILWFIEFMKKHEEKKKLQNNTMELNKLVEEVAKASKSKEEPISIIKDNTIPEIIEEKTINQPKIEEKNNTIIEAREEKPEVVIVKNQVSPIEIKPMVVSTEKTKIDTNDSIVLNDKYEEKVEIVEPSRIVPVDTPKNEEEVIKYKDEVYTEIEAKKELERITEELRKLETEDRSENIELTKFETEQEENAIISLDELLLKGKTITEQNETTQYQDDGNEPISIEELEERYKSSKENIETLTIKEEPIKKESETNNKVSIDDFLSAKTKVSTVNAYQEKKNVYHPSPIISPIYGIEEEPVVNKNTTLELENTANLKKFDDEIRKTNEFLSKLRDLQQKLD